MLLRGYSSMYQYLPTFLRVYSSVDEYLPHVFERVFVGYSSVDEYLPHVFKRVFVRERMLAPSVWEGISSMNEYSHLPRVFERVFVRRTNTCPMFLRRYSSSDEYLPHEPITNPTNTNTYLYSYSSGVSKVSKADRHKVVESDNCRWKSVDMYGSHAWTRKRWRKRKFFSGSQ